MTVGQKMQQTLNTLKSLQADIGNYALETQDQNAKQMFIDCTKQLEQITNQFQCRCDYIKTQEPQYDVYNQ